MASPIENLMARRAAEKPEMERRVKQAMRGAAVSERMLEAARMKIIDRIGSNAYAACGLSTLDLKAAIKAALMEYGK